MFSQRLEDDAFVNRPGGQDAGRGLWVLLLLVMAVLLGFVVWAATFEIEEVTRASGRVVPSSQVQTVQAPEGGIVAAIHVGEGDVVAPDQVLFEIDDTTVQANLGELEQREQALATELIRLRAEAERADALVFPDTRVWNPRLVAAERAIFDTRRSQLALELSALADRLLQREAELVELTAQRARLEAMADPLRREVEISEGLFASGSVPEIEILRLRGQLAQIEGDITVSEATELRVRASIAETEKQIESAQSSYGLTARERISIVLGDLAVVEESLRAARERVSRTDLRAPVRGTVNRISVSNVGSVVQPAVILAEIVPLDDSLLIEAEVSPRDLAFVRVGADASVKITAYDYLRYGDLPAHVERIGADALTNADGVPYFQVMLRTERTALKSADRPLEISPGMVASIDIQSGRKTVLDYLIRPVLRAQHEALRER
ncbi:HlyD family type I secretion periplasmic adaptor subunit [Shimia sp. MMG029]|uniref:HlyD family type I secretion periplasmic adaptor subunit n=1 Tax=Shimia sp. MMG029 TaxID=3021978 RepID=UPI0022FE699B|nr:HlyD family type I secretion periplasmic adaptor subunit [Shimia sp. MMG029]MDA5558988.1 HlyD family type I secretion periplasmic adaptor subunit [Shimia sp. MMG029]